MEPLVVGSMTVRINNRKICFILALSRGVEEEIVARGCHSVPVIAQLLAVAFHLDAV